MDKLVTALLSRGVVIGIKGKASSKLALDLSSVEPCHPAAIGKRVHLVGESLVWPVLFLYPEYGETDFIQEFHEDSWLVIFFPYRNLELINIFLISLIAYQIT